MHALISTLPKPYEDQVLQMWDELEEHFGCKYVRTATVPHFTWQLGERYNLRKVLPLLTQAAAETEPFDIIVQSAQTSASLRLCFEIIKNPRSSKRT